MLKGVNLTAHLKNAKEPTFAGFFISVILLGVLNNRKVA